MEETREPIVCKSTGLRTASAPNWGLEEVVERRECGTLVLSPAKQRPFRRVLYVNSNGGPSCWEKIKAGAWAPHHLWGCLELVRMGYEVAVPDALGDFYLYRRPFPHDLRFWRVMREWLGPEGIIYSGHNTMFWVPLLKMPGLVRQRLVSLLFAREPLDFARAHTGVIALTPAAADHAQKLAPRARVEHLSWGADLKCFPELPYRGGEFLSCGLTNRDHRTLSLAAARCGQPITVVHSGMTPGLDWPSNVCFHAGGDVPYGQWLREHYRSAAAVLIILNEDRAEETANGFTNLIEAMAMSRPAIVTRTGALPGEIDVEKAGCGMHVPAGDPGALAAAMEAVARDPERAREMGERGRELVRRRYSIERYATDLHHFFESL